MKTLIFSDTHLTPQFDLVKFKVLRSAIRGADKVIINGDFFDGFICSFDNFLESKWKYLFPLLKTKDTLYIYGNHDEQHLLTEKYSLFADRIAKSTILNASDKQLVITHGHKIVSSPKSIPLSMIGSVFAEAIGPNFYKVASFANNRIRNFAQREMTDNRILITGHTHLFEFSPEDSFINTGYVDHGWAQYLIVEDDNIVYVNEKYR
ncbi:MAG: metallophosphoesterase family protein [Candidatus Dojkabacteria bacterium]|jgi:predicted phosphodiesterase|nr:metallophosphoesterase family protein [Candidatus Dojkabacteria bacterium]